MPDTGSADWAAQVARAVKAAEEAEAALARLDEAIAGVEAKLEAAEAGKP